MIIPLLLMIAGFVSLYYGAEWLVDGAIKVALKLKISKVVVGLVLVAFGTSAPELFVNLIAALNGRTGFALSNISGSNLTNLCFGFGACAILGTLIVDKKKFGIDLAYFAITPLLALIFLTLAPGDSLPLWSAAPLLLLFALFLYFINQRSRDEGGDETRVSNRQTFLGLLLFLLGCGALYVGGELVVRSAVTIGVALGISEAVLGLTVVAFGTSIPDTMASIVASQKGETDIAVGNLLGSNIFNILLILSGTLLFSWGPLQANPNIIMDYTVITVMPFVFIVLVTFSEGVSRLSGGGLILIYAFYMLYRVLLEAGLLG